MRIMADEDGKRVVAELADIALKTRGLKNLDAINALLNGVEDIPKKVDKKELKKDD